MGRRVGLVERGRVGSGHVEELLGKVLRVFWDGCQSYFFGQAKIFSESPGRGWGSGWEGATSLEEREARPRRRCYRRWCVAGARCDAVRPARGRVSAISGCARAVGGRPTPVGDRPRLVCDRVKGAGDDRRPGCDDLGTLGDEPRTLGDSTRAVCDRTRAISYEHDFRCYGRFSTVRDWI